MSRAGLVLSARSVVSLALIPAGFACGGLLTQRVLGQRPARLGVDLAQPLPVVTEWGAYGGTLCAIFAATLLVAALGAWSARGQLRADATAGRRAPVVALVLCAALTLAIALAWPVAYSSDVYAYAAYGELARQGLDPYAPAPPKLDDAFLNAARWQWSGTFPVCVYGPAFVAFAEGAVTLFAPLGVAATLLALRAFACLAFLAAAALFWKLLEARPAGERVAALAAFLLNPVALWSVAEGHNDVLMVCVALAGFALVRRGAPFAGGAALGLTPLVKLPAALAGPLLAISLAASGRLRAAAALAAGFALALALALVLVVPRALTAAASFAAHGRYAPQLSLQAVTGPVPALAFCALVGLFGLSGLARGRASGALWIAVALWIALPNPYPWYALWVLPVAAAFEGRLAAGLWVATITGALRYLPDAYGPLSRGPTLLALTFQLAPLALAALAGRQPRARGKATGR